MGLHPSGQGAIGIMWLRMFDVSYLCTTRLLLSDVWCATHHQSDPAGSMYGLSIMHMHCS